MYNLTALVLYYSHMLFKNVINIQNDNRYKQIKTFSILLL